MVDANEYQERYQQLLKATKDTLQNETSRKLLEEAAEKSKQSDKHDPFIENISTILEPVSTFLLAGNNAYITKALREVIPDIDIHIREYPSAAPNAFTIPFVNCTRSKFVEVALGLPIRSPVILLVSALMFFETIGNIIKGNIGEPYVENKKLYIPNMNACTIYVSSSLVRILTPEQLIAIILHEVGHNTQKALYISSRIAPLVGNLMLFMLLCFGFTEELGDEDTAVAQAGNVARSDVKTQMQALTLSKMSMAMKASIVACVLFFTLISIFIARKMEWKADKYAKQCGYGDELQSALMRLDIYFRNDALENHKSMARRLINGILSLVWRVSQFFGKIKLAAHPDVPSRVRALEGEDMESSSLIDSAIDKLITIAVKLGELLRIGK